MVFFTTWKDPRAWAAREGRDELILELLGLVSIAGKRFLNRSGDERGEVGELL